MYEARHWESAYRDFNADNVPKLLIQLQDDLARSRRREAAWISIIVHLVLIILIWNEARLETFFGKWWRRPVVVVSPGELQRQKELTYLELPPDQQKLTKRPNTNIISDKDRIATSRKAHLDPKELKRILDSSRPGLPGPSTPPAASQPSQPPVAAQNAAPQPQQAAQQQPPAPAPSADQNQMAKLETPPLPKKPPKVTFSSSMSAQSAVQQAERAALANRGAGQVGEEGDYGLGQGNRGSQVLGPMEVLSDTMGVDFGPYLQRVLHDVRENWYNLIPEVARAPIMKKGQLTIEFAILKDGRVAGMKRVASSGDTALDRAAWGGITGSNPFPPLPPQFGGEYLGLRFKFYYNPDKADLE
jgi:TonB family protein